MRKVYFLALTSYPDIGGVQTSILSCAQKLVDKGYDVEIISACFDKRESKEFRYEGVLFRKFYVNPSRIPFVNECKIIFAFNSFVKISGINFEEGITFSRSVLLSYACTTITNSYLITLFPTTTSLDFDGRKQRRKNGIKSYIARAFFKINESFYKYIESIVIRKSEVIVFSDLMKKCISKEHKKKAIEVVRPGVNEEYFTNEKTLRKNGKVLFVGRLASNKNIYHLADIISETDDSVLFTIVGDGPDRVKLENYLNTKGILNRVNILGKKTQQELVDIYREHSLTILPSRIETFGLTIIESMACGTPVIAYKPDGEIVKTASAEIIIENTNGFLVDNYNEKNMAASIMDALSEVKNNADKYNSDCVNYVYENYRWDNIVNYIMSKVEYD
ncbi:glycosyltransferase family 4 protein [Vibrio vulnificus]|nr:glycosyltransferase family 4 protein [Vibrio vulnificus]